MPAILSDSELKSKGPPTTWDNTMLTTADGCLRKLYWFLRGVDYELVPAYFTYGKVFQEMLNVWYLPESIGHSRPFIEMETEEAFHFIEEILQHGRREWDKDSPREDKTNNWLMCKQLMQLYIQQYPTEDWKVVAMETGWEWPIKGTPYFLAGSLDGYIEWNPYGLLVLEDKTTGMYMSDTYISSWEFSSQVTQYVWYLSQLQGREIFGCLMNMASKRIPKKKIPENLFARSLEKRSPDQLNRFEKATVQLIEDINREWDRWTFRKTKDNIQCVGGIGKSACLFRPLCSAEDEFYNINPLQFPGIVARDGEWSPWKRGEI